MTKDINKWQRYKAMEKLRMGIVGAGDPGEKRMQAFTTSIRLPRR